MNQEQFVDVKIGQPIIMLKSGFASECLRKFEIYGNKESIIRLSFKMWKAKAPNSGHWTNVIFKGFQDPILFFTDVSFYFISWYTMCNSSILVQCYHFGFWDPVYKGILENSVQLSKSYFSIYNLWRKERNEFWESMTEFIS